MGVGGSSGKTSVAHLTALILNSKYKVRETSGKNSETGIPLAILGIDPGNYSVFGWFIVFLKSIFAILTNFKKYDVLVAELGIDGPKPPKNMAYLLKIIKPNISILTNISLEHSVYFEEFVHEKDDKKRKDAIFELIKDDELRLIKNIDSKSTAIVNFDDEAIKESLKDVRAKIISVSWMNKNATYFIRSFDVTIDQTRINFSFDGKDYEISIQTPLPSFYSYSIVLSIAVANVLNISANDAKETIEENFSLPSGRLSIFDGIKNTKIIDSSYNNSIEALGGVLEMVAKIGGGKRKIGILGDIREQGKQSEELHKQMARKIIDTLDFVILIGPMTQSYIAPILKKNKFQFKSFLTYSETKQYIPEAIEKGDLIIVKGSQNTLLLERVVEMLLKNKEDVKKLCRRGEYWDQQRQITP